MNQGQRRAQHPAPHQARLPERARRVLHQGAVPGRRLGGYGGGCGREEGQEVLSAARGEGLQEVGLQFVYLPQPAFRECMQSLRKAMGADPGGPRGVGVGSR